MAAQLARPDLYDRKNGFRTVKAVVLPLSHSLFKAEDADMAPSTTALALGSERVKVLKASHI